MCFNNSFCLFCLMYCIKLSTVRLFSLLLCTKPDASKNTMLIILLCLDVSDPTPTMVN